MSFLRFFISPLIVTYQSIFLAVGQIWSNKVRSISSEVKPCSAI